MNYNYLKISSQVGQSNESTHRKSFESKAARKRLGSDEEHFIKYRTVLDQKRYQKFAISVAIEMNKASKKRKAKKNTSKRQQKLDMGRIKTTFPTNMQVLQVWRTKGKL